MHHYRIAVVCIAFAFSLTTTSANAGRSDIEAPTMFARNLYRSYVTDVYSKLFTWKPSERPAREAAWRSQWLTPQFAANYSSIAESSGTDPIISAQDYCTSWADDIDTSLVSGDALSAVVTITLNAHRQSWRRLTASLKKVSGHWRLDAVTGVTNGPATSCAE